MKFLPVIVIHQLLIRINLYLTSGHLSYPVFFLSPAWPLNYKFDCTCKAQRYHTSINLHNLHSPESGQQLPTTIYASCFSTNALTEVVAGLNILVEQELFTLPEHPSPYVIYCGVCVVRSLIFCVVFCRSLFVLSPFFHLVIVLSMLLQFEVSDYPFANVSNEEF